MTQKNEDLFGQLWLWFLFKINNQAHFPTRGVSSLPENCFLLFTGKSVDLGSAALSIHIKETANFVIWKNPNFLIFFLSHKENIFMNTWWTLTNEILFLPRQFLPLLALKYVIPLKHKVHSC